MTTGELSRLKPVDLRTVWTSEDKHFTPWLAQEENLALLGNTIRMELDFVAMEKNIGPFRADIVCKDTVTDGYVLIENQLERTDHNHLGQLLTYAAGLDAVTIVWIADRFTDEHRAALDWLNEVTNEDINLFGLEIELWQIADSPIAPKFNIISKPNDWVQIVSASRQSGSEVISPIKAQQLEYWEALMKRLDDNNSPINTRKPRPQHWMHFAVGRSGFRMSAIVSMREGRIGLRMEIHGGDIKEYFHLLHEQKDEIEADIGETLEWRELPDRKQSDVTLYNYNYDPNIQSQWPEQHAWFQKQLEAFHRAFSPRIRALDANDYVPDDEPDEL